MTTENQTPTQDQTPSNPASAAPAPQGNEGGQTNTGGAPDGGAGKPDAGVDAAALAAAKAEADKQAAEKAAADKAAAEKAQQEQVEARAKAQRDVAVNSWKAAAKADAEIGGDKFEASVIDAEQGVKAVGNEGLAQLLEVSGLKHHPDVLRAFAKIGALVKEGVIRNGQAPSGKPRSREEILYDKTPAK